MKLYVNGEPRDVEADLTLARLLELLEVPRAGVAVEVNREIVRRAQHATHRLAPEDRVEVVTFVGGG